MGDIAASAVLLGQRTHVANTGVYGMAGGQSMGGGGAGAAWPVANTAFFCPVRLPREQLLYGFGIASGATASGNFDAGLYAKNGARIVSLGSTAYTLTNNVQKGLLGTPFLLPPDWYYMALVLDNATGLILRYNAVGGGVEGLKSIGMLEQASAFPLPATATPVAPTQNYLPVFGLLFRTSP